MLWDPDGWVYLYFCPELRRLQPEDKQRRAVRETKKAVTSGKWF